MSHFTKLGIKIVDRSSINTAVTKMGWRVEHMPEYHSPYGEFVKDCDVYKDAQGKVKMVVSRDGTIIVDPYYMKHDYQRFCQEYASASIASSAMDEGGWIGNCYTDEKTGELVVETVFA